LCYLFRFCFVESVENERGGGEFLKGVKKENKILTTNQQKSPQPFVNIPPEQREGGEKHFLITPLKNEAALTFQVPRQEMKVGNLSSASPRSRCYYGLPERFFYFFFLPRDKDVAYFKRG